MERVGLRLRAQDDGLRWSSPEQWHITLAFLGEVSAAAESALVTELRRLRVAPVRLRIDGLGVFERAGILHAVVDVSPGLEELQHAVAQAAKGSGLPPEERPYCPHITLARSKGRAGSRAIQRLKASLEQQRPRAAWTATEFLLYESLLSPGGARYRMRERFPLDGARA